MKPVLRIIKVLFGLRFQFETDVLVHSQSCFPFFFSMTTLKHIEIPKLRGTMNSLTSIPLHLMYNLL